jgi:hypothetical protein
MAESIKTKKEIVEELLLTEEETLTKLKTLIDRTKNFIGIDKKTHKIVVSSKFDFANFEKILLFLIGKYYSKELGLSETEGMQVKDLGKESGIVRTTLSRPLGELEDAGYIGQDEKRRYFVQYYKIEDIVNALYSKYIEKKPSAKGIQLKRKQKTKKGRV